MADGTGLAAGTLRRAPDHLMLELLAATVLVTLVLTAAPRLARAAGSVARAIIRVARRLFAPRPPPLPVRTLRCTPRQPAASWWQEVELDGRPALLLVSDWQATNIWDRPVRIETAFLRKPRAAARHVRAVSVAVAHPEIRLLGDYAIAPGRTAPVAVKLWLQPPPGFDEAELTASLTFVDELGNEHRPRELRFLPFSHPAILRALGLAGVAPPSGGIAKSAQGVPAAGAKRRHPRASVDLETEVWTSLGGRLARHEGRTRVVGMGGAFVELQDPVPPGSLVRIQLRLQDLSALVCKAIVRNVLEPGGIGVEFCELAAGDRQRLGALVLNQRG